jgi:hypothetical protein
MLAHGWLGEDRLISSQPLTHWHVTHTLSLSLSFFSFSPSLPSQPNTPPFSLHFSLLFLSSFSSSMHTAETHRNQTRERFRVMSWEWEHPWGLKPWVVWFWGYGAWATVGAWRQWLGTGFQPCFGEFLLLLFLIF